MHFYANDLESVTVRGLHVAAKYYEARRLHGRLHGRWGGFAGSGIYINISQTRLQCIQARVATANSLNFLVFGTVDLTDRKLYNTKILNLEDEDLNLVLVLAVQFR